MANYDQVFTSSYQRALGNNCYQSDFISSFYQDFLATSPLVASLFANTNMGLQKTMLHDSLHILLDFYNTKQITPYLLKLASIHGQGGYKVPKELYDFWMDSLIRTLAKFDTEFNKEVELAWRLVMAPGITFIRFMG